MKKRIKHFIVIGLIALFVLEILLRVIGVNKSYSEKTSGTYIYQFDNQRSSWFHTWPPNTDFVFEHKEFSFYNKTNELGHRELSFKNFEQDTTSIKIVCLGDSFTEGDGAPYDSSWVRFFEKNLALELDTPVFAYNAGVCGSDVLFNFQMLKEKLVQAKPKMVIECLNNSDIIDIYYKGGQERFLSDGTTGAPNAKNWEILYKYSYIFRAFLVYFTAYDNYLIKQDPSEQELALQIIANQVNQTYELCIENKIEYRLVVMPIPSDVQLKIKHIFESLPDSINKEISVINLYPILFSIYDSIPVEEYSWPINGHYNGKGYKIFGDAVFQEYMKSQELIN
jgi:hypothetical protein